MSDRRSDGLLALIVIGAIVLCIAGLFALAAAWKSYNRYQKRADANNSVKVTNILIRRARQQVRVQQQLARVKYAESVGIRRAQDEISKTLTDQYLQHEAIQAQKMMARSDNHTQIYIPSGQNGLPLVATTPDSSK